MSEPFDNRVLALAGLAQALQQVRRIAETGQSNPVAARVVMDSIFRIDAESVLAVFGGEARNLHNGLRVLNDFFTNQLQDGALKKLAMDVMRLERRFIANHQIVAAISEGIQTIAPQARAAGGVDPEVIVAIGKLYADTISHMQPRIMIMGNPHYLGQPAVATEVRAIMLAALRSTVLWRQLGGSPWHLLFSKRAMAEAVAHWLQR